MTYKLVLLAKQSILKPFTKDLNIHFYMMHCYTEKPFLSLKLSPEKLFLFKIFMLQYKKGSRETISDFYNLFWITKWPHFKSVCSFIFVQLLTWHQFKDNLFKNYFQSFTFNHKYSPLCCQHIRYKDSNSSFFFISIYDMTNL